MLAEWLAGTDCCGCFICLWHNDGLTIEILMTWCINTLLCPVCWGGWWNPALTVHTVRQTWLSVNVYSVTITGWLMYKLIPNLSEGLRNLHGGVEKHLTSELLSPGNLSVRWLQIRRNELSSHFLLSWSEEPTYWANRTWNGTVHPPQWLIFGFQLLSTESAGRKRVWLDWHR